MAENREHIEKYAKKLVRHPEWQEDINIYDLVDTFVDGAEWMLKRAEKRRAKDILKLRQIITKLEKENNEYRQQLGLKGPKPKKEVNLYRFLRGKNEDINPW